MKAVRVVVLCVVLALAALTESAAAANVAHKLWRALREKNARADAVAAAHSASASSAARFYGFDCTPAFITAQQWTQRATAAGVQADPQVVEVGQILAHAQLTPLVKAQTCGQKYADRTPQPANAGHTALWGNLQNCVIQYIDGQNRAFRAVRPGFLRTGGAGEHWSIEPAGSPGFTAAINALYTKREFQHAYGGAGLSRACTTDGAPGVPACRTTVCATNTGANCMYAGSQPLVEWRPVNGQRARAVWARAGMRNNYLQPFSSYESWANAATLKIQTAAVAGAHAGIAVDFVKWDVSKCTYTVSTSGSKGMFTSLVNGCAVYIARDATSGRVMMIHANANGIGAAHSRVNSDAKERCANQILENHNRVYMTHFAKVQKMTSAQYVTANSKLISIYGILQPGGARQWDWRVTYIDAHNNVQTPEPRWVRWR